MSNENWDNSEPVGFRTKLALKLLLLMFKVLSPYRFEHRFADDLKEIEKMITNA